MDIKKVYYYFYYKIYNFSVGVSDDFLNEIKPVSIITITEIFLVADLMIWYTIIAKKDFSPILFYFVIGGFIIFNSYFFLIKKEKEKYFKEFKKYGRNKNILGGWIVLLIIMLSLASLIFSFYKMSLIDWSKYR